MANQQRPCPLCGLTPQSISEASTPVEVLCPKCGSFQFLGPPTISELRHLPKFIRDKWGAALDWQRATEILKTYLSIYTRECFESGRPTEVLDLANPSALERLAETYAYTPITEKPNKMLRLIERRTEAPGDAVSVRPQIDYPAAHALNTTELVYYLKALANDHYIESQMLELIRDPNEPGIEYDAFITLEGWKRLAQTGAASRIGFVAMSFADELNSTYSEGIEPAIHDAGYEPLRVDRVHHNEKICDRIIAQVRRARFVIADVTLQKAGVYFEAGFAMALNLPVIWSCRKDDLPNVHFDTRQYNHVVWESPTAFGREGAANELIHRKQARTGD